MQILVSEQSGSGWFMEGYMAATWTIAKRMPFEKEYPMLPRQQALVPVLHPSEQASAQCGLGSHVYMNV